MLGYYPSQKKWDGKFRNIKLQVDRQGTQLRYRRGYFAVNPSDWRKDNGERMLAAALTANSLPSTEVTFMARAPPPQPDTDAGNEFAVNPSPPSFRTQAGNRPHVPLQLEVQAFTPH